MKGAAYGAVIGLLYFLITAISWYGMVIGAKLLMFLVSFIPVQVYCVIGGMFVLVGAGLGSGKDD